MWAEAQVCSGPGMVNEVSCDRVGLVTRCNGGRHERGERKYFISPKRSSCVPKQFNLTQFPHGFLREHSQIGISKLVQLNWCDSCS